MNILTKNLLGAAVVASLALSGTVQADDVIKHRTIDINLMKGQDINVKVESELGSESLVFSQDELHDQALLEAKLANLDPETRQTVLQALYNIRQSPEGDGHVVEERVFVLNKGEGEHVQIMGDDGEDVEIEIIDDGQRKMVRKHIIHGDDKFRVLKGHSDVITKLIEKGEFSRDELDKIQAALDAKR